MVLRLHGYGAWIELDGEPLEEYAVEVKENVISCYVCSEERKKFVLHFDDDGSYSCGQATTFGSYGRSIVLMMDGQEVGSLWGGVKQKLTSDGMRDGDIIRHYVFAPIDTTDDDDVAASEDPNNEHIGTIQMELIRSIKTGPGTGGARGTGLGTGPIHERSKKAGSHRVALGEGYYRPQNSVKVANIDHNTWLTFRFLYRTRGILKAQGIVPQSPSPSPSPNDSPGPSVKVEGGKSNGKEVKRKREDDGDVIEVLSDDGDLDSLQDELKRIQDRIARKKAKKIVKREPVLLTDDVIDLT